MAKKLKELGAFSKHSLESSEKKQLQEQINQALVQKNKG
ncbi:MAG: IDEAL domain-containing protein [Fluviicola sp.]